MFFQLPKLPYDTSHFEPFMSQETFDYHYGKHHRTYIENLNKLLLGSGFENSNLNDIVMNSSGELFNNAAQSWNHSFFWFGIHPETSQPEKGSHFLESVYSNFQSLDNLRDEIVAKGKKVFGSGYVWLVKEGSNKMFVTTTSNAEVPFRDNRVIPLFNCDVWEHAYYLDHRNDRAKFLNNFWTHINWHFVERNFHREEPLDLTIAMKPRGTPLESDDFRVHH